MSYNEQLRCDCLTTNHEGPLAWSMTPECELYTTVVTTIGLEDKFYESGNIRVKRIADLVHKVQPEFVAQLAIYARETMHLRSVPLLLLVELARHHQGDSLVSRAVSRTVQRADEIAELLMCYQWRTGKKGLKHLSCQLRKGLAGAFNHFDEYQFAKYDRQNRKVTLRDALLLVHPKPKDERQKNIFRKILNGELATPYTWETELSKTGQQHYATKEEKQKAVREKWQELIASRRMGYMATMRNLCNMLDAEVDNGSVQQVCSYLSNPEAVKNSRQLPFRFLSAFLQVQHHGNILPLQDCIDLTELRIEKVQNTLAWRKDGMYPRPVRKTVRYVPLMSLGRRMKLCGNLKAPFPKVHFSRVKYLHTTEKKLSEKEKRENVRMERDLQHQQTLLEALKKKQAIVTNSNKWQRLTLCHGDILQTLEQAASLSAANIAGFDENTRVLLASDTSGSMFQPVSRNSSVMCYHIGLLLSMLMKHRCPQAVTGMFGDIWKTFDMPSGNVLQNTVDMWKHEGEVGFATNGYKVIDWLIEEERVMDKVMLFTDMQLWNNCRYDAHLVESWNRYKKIAPDAKLYLFDLAGYGQSPVSMERDDVFCIAGWSDKVFDILAALERGNSAIDEIRRIAV